MDKMQNTKTCPNCGTSFSCSPFDCWCAELPKVPVYEEGLDCFCPTCLKEKLETN